MTLSDIAKQELKTHMDIELGRNQLPSAAQMELETHMKLELRGSYSIDYKVSNKNFINLNFY